jgi:hypothetical protein
MTPKMTSKSSALVPFAQPEPRGDEKETKADGEAVRITTFA